MTTFDKEWQDGDDAELENEAYSAGFSEGKDSLADDMRLMFVDLAEALREELEVHDEPSAHLVECVGLWALRLHELGLMSDGDKKYYFQMTDMEEDDND
jgi:hypothetical protein